MKIDGARIGRGMDLPTLWHPQARRVGYSTDDGKAAEAVARETLGKNVAGVDSCRRNVANKLVRLIHTGGLEAGDLLPSERELCEIFGVARQTLRGALGILVARLMITVSHGRRSRVLGAGHPAPADCGETLRRLPERSVAEVAQARLALDSQLASLAAKAIGAQELRRLEAFVAQQERVARDPVCFHVFDFEFHSLVYHSSGNRLLAEIAMDLYGYAAPLRRRGMALSVSARGIAGRHGCIVAALRDRDAERTALAMADHARQLCWPQVALE